MNKHTSSNKKKFIKNPSNFTTDSHGSDYCWRLVFTKKKTDSHLSQRKMYFQEGVQFICLPLSCLWLCQEERRGSLSVPEVGFWCHYTDLQGFSAKASTSLTAAYH